MYKVANGIVPEQTQFLFNKCTDIHSHNTKSASPGNYVILKMKRAKGQTGYVFSGAQVWNDLPTHIKQVYSTKYMMTIKLNTFLVKGFFYSFSICLVYFLVEIFIFCCLLLSVIFVLGQFN